MNFIKRSKNTRPRAILSVALSSALLLSLTPPVGVAGAGRKNGAGGAGETTATVTTGENARSRENIESI